METPGLYDYDTDNSPEDHLPSSPHRLTGISRFVAIARLLIWLNMHSINAWEFRHLHVEWDRNDLLQMNGRRWGGIALLFTAPYFNFIFGQIQHWEQETGSKFHQTFTRPNYLYGDDYD